MPESGQLIHTGAGVGIGVEGPVIKAIGSATATLTYGSLTAAGSDQSVTVAGARTADVAIASPVTDLGNTALGWCARVSADDTVSVRVFNQSAGAINPTDVAWRVVVFRYTV